MADAALFIPIAHVGHWLWILYVLPVLIVVVSIVRTTVSEKRKAREEEKENGASEDLGEPPLERR
jgi:cytochrome c-type biogenesis protein CcmH/NrfF